MCPRTLARGIVLVALALACGCSIAAPGYVAQRIGTLGGTATNAMALNSRGDVTGGSQTAGNVAEHAFLFANGTLRDLGAMSGIDSAGYDVNDAGAVVGEAVSADGHSHAFVYSNGSAIDLGTLGGTDSYAYGINENGQVAGTTTNAAGDTRAFLYSGGRMIDLVTLGGANSAAWHVNRYGDVAGMSETAGGEIHAFLYRNGHMQDLGTLGGPISMGFALNDAGVVVGMSLTATWDVHAFVYTDGRMQDLGTLDGAETTAYAINNLGQIVGMARSATGTERAFYYDGALHDLTAITAGLAGTVLDAALDINDAGQIAVAGFRLDPVQVIAVEFYHAAYDHYFVTIAPAEIAALDTGAISGWTRTGLSFAVFPLGTAGASNVCRFWSGPTFVTKSSHFYTPYPWECEEVKGNRDWQFEGEVFALELPYVAGTCPTGRSPLYRLYNDGKGDAPNHRYTTSLAVRATMLAQGWIAEGAGIGVIGCVPGS